MIVRENTGRKDPLARGGDGTWARVESRRARLLALPPYASSRSADRSARGLVKLCTLS
jgi:hypothetical protein